MTHNFIVPLRFTLVLLKCPNNPSLPYRTVHRHPVNPLDKHLYPPCLKKQNSAINSNFITAQELLQDDTLPLYNIKIYV